MCTVGLTSAWKINSMLNYRKFKPLNLFKLSCTATEDFKQFKAVLIKNFQCAWRSHLQLLQCILRFRDVGHHYAHCAVTLPKYCS